MMIKRVLCGLMSLASLNALELPSFPEFSNAVLTRSVSNSNNGEENFGFDPYEFDRLVNSLEVVSQSSQNDSEDTITKRKEGGCTQPSISDLSKRRSSEKVLEFFKKDEQTGGDKFSRSSQHNNQLCFPMSTLSRDEQEKFYLPVFAAAMLKSASSEPSTITTAEADTFDDSASHFSKMLNNNSDESEAVNPIPAFAQSLVKSFRESGNKFNEGYEESLNAKLCVMLSAAASRKDNLQFYENWLSTNNIFVDFTCSWSKDKIKKHIVAEFTSKSSEDNKYLEAYAARILTQYVVSRIRNNESVNKKRKNNGKPKRASKKSLIPIMQEGESEQDFLNRQQKYKERRSKNNAAAARNREKKRAEKLGGQSNELES